MFGDKSTHYPKLPDANFVGLRIDRTKNEKNHRSRLPPNVPPKRSAYVSDKTKSKDTMDDLDQNISQFLSHGFPSEKSPFIEEEPIKNNTPIYTKAIPPKVAKTSLTPQRADHKVEKSPKNTTLPACNIRVETYNTEPKAPQHNLKIQIPNNPASTEPITSSQSDASSKVRKPESNIANLRKARQALNRLCWMRCSTLERT